MAEIIVLNDQVSFLTDPVSPDVLLLPRHVEISSCARGRATPTSTRIHSASKTVRMARARIWYAIRCPRAKPSSAP